jgi:hypothetical protein
MIKTLTELVRLRYSVLGYRLVQARIANKTPAELMDKLHIRTTQ